MFPLKHIYKVSPTLLARLTPEAWENQSLMSTVRHSLAHGDVLSVMARLFARLP